MHFPNRLFSMTRTAGAVVLGLLGLAAASPGATIPLYQNNSAYSGTGPQIDARAWVNRSLFDVFTATGLPFESQNTLFFTNTPSGIMFGTPGFRFFNNTNGQRLWMDTWVNEGSIATDWDSFLGGIFFIDSRASILQVQATNIISKGPLSSGAQGLVRLEGRTVRVPRIGIRTGTSDLSGSGGGSGTTFLGVSNYVNDIGVTDLYWGGGTNNAMRANQPAMPLDSFGGVPNFNLPFASSPYHDVASRSFFGTLFTNQTVVPNGFFGTNLFFNFGQYAAVAHRTVVSPTSSVVQVVFYPTNSDPGVNTEVRFQPFGNAGARVFVGFHTIDFDIATQTATSNSVYLVDELGITTNVFFARNLGASTRRPSTYDLTRGLPFGYFGAVTGNLAFTSNLISSANYTETSVTNLYAAYAANVANLGSSPSGSIPYDVTNVPGRVEIIGNEVDLDQTRIRAESAVIIKANNIASNRLAAVDAPLINFDVGTQEPTLVISNLAPATVRRFSGTVRAWSGRWQNQEIVTQPGGTTTNTVRFHVLVVDNQLQSDLPVAVNEFALRGNDLVIHDVLNIRKSFRLTGDSLHLVGGLNLPFGYGLGASNLIGLVNFTNDGVINITGSQYIGSDRPSGYEFYINRGTNIAATHSIRADVVDNSGCIRASSGPLLIDATTVTLEGNPLIASTNLFTNIFVTIGGTITNVFTNVVSISAPPKLESVSEIRIRAQELTASNSLINAGTLNLEVTDSLIDRGTNGVNQWNVTAGFRTGVLPAFSDLMATHVRSAVPRFALAEHSWAGQDLGPVSAGFQNNLALGRLTVDAQTNSLFVFRPVNGVNALYVDYIEMLNNATNYNAVFSIDPNFTIYFANANVSVEKLNGALGGRFVWVSEFAGPLSSTNITYGSGITYTFNIALASSKDLDSDGDGIVNANDPEPFYVPESAFIRVSLAAAPERCAVLNWTALANATNIVEYKNSTGEASWRTLTNFVHGPYTMPVSVMDPLSTNGTSRVYRLRVDPMRY